MTTDLSFPFFLIFLSLNLCDSENAVQTRKTVCPAWPYTAAQILQ